MRRIFDGIGVQMTTDTFDKVWEMAQAKDPSSNVSLKLSTSHNKEHEPSLYSQF